MVYRDFHYIILWFHFKVDMNNQFSCLFYNIKIFVMVKNETKVNIFDYAKRNLTNSLQNMTQLKLSLVYVEFGFDLSESFAFRFNSKSNK